MESKDVRILWIALLAMADPNGFVDASLPGLANFANLSKEEVEKALAVLMSPDEYSKNPSNDGRRVEKVARGWQILNYAHFRAWTPNQRTEDATASNPNTPHPGFVYYAAWEDRVKIGFSKNPWARVTSLAVAAPGITLLAMERGDETLETHRHAEFEDIRLKGEWFQLDARLSAHIEAIRTARTTEGSARSTTVARKAEGEGDVEAKAVKEPTPPARAEVQKSNDKASPVEGILSTLAIAPERRSSWGALITGMAEGIGGPGGKLVPWDVLREAADELATAGGTYSAHRYKTFVSKVLERRQKEAEPKVQRKFGPPEPPRIHKEPYRAEEVKRSADPAKLGEVMQSEYQKLAASREKPKRGAA